MSYNSVAGSIGIPNQSHAMQAARYLVPMRS